jgi:hypothetical protein
MAIFNGHILTDDGRNLIGRALAGDGRFLFTKAAFGDGVYTGNIRELTELIAHKLNLIISDKINDNGTVLLKVQISNSTVINSFLTKEFGIYAKIEGDAEDKLYAYAAAVEPDAFPNNSSGVTMQVEHNVYITLTSDIEAEIFIQDGTVFLTAEVANKNYVLTGLIARGALNNGRINLEANKQYMDGIGNWYKNIGGNRAWTNGNGIADFLLKEISWEQHERDLEGLIGAYNGSFPISLITGTIEVGTIWYNPTNCKYYICKTETISPVTGPDSNFAELSLKQMGTDTLNNAITNISGGQADGYIQDGQPKITGRTYLDKATNKIFKCIQNDPSGAVNYADANYFVPNDNDTILKRLDNLIKFMDVWAAFQSTILYEGYYLNSYSTTIPSLINKELISIVLQTDIVNPYASTFYFNKTTGNIMYRYLNSNSSPQPDLHKIHVCYKDN